MKRILITGGAGFIGSHLSERLLSENHQITILDNLETGDLNNINSFKNKVNFIKGNILDKKIVDTIMKNIDYVFHLAAKITVQKSFSQTKEYESVNINGTKTLLEAALKNKVKRFIFASSAAVYGNTNNLPICEENVLPSPISPLGRTKHEAEKICIEAGGKGLPVTIFRFFNVYGPRQSLKNNNVITQFITSSILRKNGVIFGSGKQLRDFIYIDDVIDAYSKAIKDNGTNNIFNIGSGIPTTINDLYKLIINPFHLKSFPPIYKEANEGDIINSYSCICRAKNFLDFEPKINLNEGIKTTLDYFIKSK